MFTKTFEYKGQYINYFNKVRQNPRIAELYGGFRMDLGKWVLEYNYKKN